MRQMDQQTEGKKTHNENKLENAHGMQLFLAYGYQRWIYYFQWDIEDKRRRRQGLNVQKTNITLRTSIIERKGLPIFGTI